MIENSPGSTKAWMPLYVGDYLADTAHLTTEQSGAYLHLLMHYWRNGPLLDNDSSLAQITKLSPDAWSIAQAMLRPFFFVGEDGKLHQKRSDKELAVWNDKALRAKEKAQKAAHSRWGENARSIPPSNQQAMLEQCPSPSPSPIKTKTTDSNESSSGNSEATKKKKSSAGDIERVRLAYPLKKAPGAARKAIGKAMERLASRGESDPAAFLIARIAEWKAARDRDERAGRFVPSCPYPATWMNEERYDEEGLDASGVRKRPAGPSAAEEQAADFRRRKMAVVTQEVAIG
jgi:uncharacterized protein YdaU (DUF1376 family)